MACLVSAPLICAATWVCEGCSTGASRARRTNISVSAPSGASPMYRSTMGPAHLANSLITSVSMPRAARCCAPVTRNECPPNKFSPSCPIVSNPRRRATSSIVLTTVFFCAATPSTVGNSSPLTTEVSGQALRSAEVLLEEGENHHEPRAEVELLVTGRGERVPPKDDERDLVRCRRAHERALPFARPIKESEQEELRIREEARRSGRSGAAAKRPGWGERHRRAPAGTPTKVVAAAQFEPPSREPIAAFGELTL